MSECRVFLMCTHRLFCEAVQIILKREGGMELLGIETDQHKALESIKSLQPDVILIEGNIDATDFSARVWDTIRDRTGVRLINLDSDNNEISIYHKQQRMLTTSQDLIEVIRRDIREAEPLPGRVESDETDSQRP